MMSKVQEQQFQDIELLRKKNKQFQEQQRGIEETLDLEREVIDQINAEMGAAKGKMATVKRNADKALKKIGGFKGVAGGLGTLVLLAIVFFVFH